MYTLYENIITLCKSKGITGSKMCSDLGISRSILTGLKNGTKKSVSSETLQRFADYLGVTTDYLLGKETTENKKSPTPEGVELNVSASDLRHLKAFHAADEDTRQIISMLLKKFEEEQE